jgi:Major Facilitator Superfamily
MFVVLMLYFQQARGWSAAVSGAAFLPVAVGISLGAPLAGWLRRTGQFGTLAVGLGATTAAVLSLAFAGTSTPFAALVAPLVAFGAGAGMAMTAANGGAVEGSTTRPRARPSST